MTTVEILASYVNQDPHDTLLIYDYPRNNEDVEGAYHARSSTHGYIVAFCIFGGVSGTSDFFGAFFLYNTVARRRVRNA